MDLAAIREDLAVVMADLGYNAYSYVMADPETYPAAFAGLPSSMVPLTKSLWTVTLPLTMLFSTADEADAQRRLDTALSPGATGSVYDALHAATSTAWNSLRWVRADNAREVLIGNSRIFAFDVTLELTA